MATVIYPAIVERAVDGFSMCFPDLPGLTSAGRTEQEAFVNAEDALAGHVAKNRSGFLAEAACEALARKRQLAAA